MGWTKTALRHLRAFGRIDGFECEIEAELLFHVEMRQLENMQAGMAAETARQQALEQFGDLEQVKQQCAVVRRDGLTARMTRALKRLCWALALIGLSLGLTSNVMAVRQSGQVLVAIAVLLRLFFYVKHLTHQTRRPHAAQPQKILFDE